MSEEVKQEESQDIPNEVVNEIEKNIEKLDIEQQKLLLKTISEKYESDIKKKEDTYKEELEKLNKKYNKEVREKETIKKEAEDKVSVLEKKFDQFAEKLERTWGQYNPQSKALVNSQQNPFKDKDPKELLSSIKSMDDLKKNPELSKYIENEFHEMLNR